MKPIPPLRVLIALSLALLSIALIGVGGRLYFVHQKNTTRLLAEEMLGSVADLKTKAIAAWMKERRGDAAVLSNSTLLKQLLEVSTDSPALPLAKKQLEEFAHAYDYAAVALYDAQGVLQLETRSDPLRPCSRLPAAIAEALRMRDMVFLDIHRDEPGGPVHLCFLQPVQSQTARPGQGVIVLTVNPYRFLFPYMQTWPALSQTAETMLVRREGNEVVFLNELRHQKGTELTLKHPLAAADQLPAVWAVLGQERVGAGIDYRGVPVLAATRKITGTPWFMVAKVDETEIYSPVSRSVWMIVVVVVLSLAVAALGVVLFWWQHALEFTQRELLERTQAETALRESEIRLRNLSNNLPGGMTYQIDFGAEGKIRQFTYVSSGVERMHELSVETVLRDSSLLYNQILPEDRPIIAANEARAQATMTPIASEVRFRLPSGKVRWGLLNSAPRRLQNGHLIWDGIELDITDRKQADEALRISERKLSEIFQASPECIAVTTLAEGRVLEVNEAYTAMLGFERTEVVGRTVQDFNLWPTPEERTRVVSLVKKDGRVRNVETAIRSKSGAFIDVLMSMATVTVDGQACLVTLATDITERKRIEHELEVSRSNLSALLESTDDMIWSVDLDFRLLTFNSRLQQHLNKDYGTVAHRGDLSTDILPPEQAASWPALYRRALSDGPYRLEYGLPDGRTLKLSFNPIVRDGVQSGVSVFGKDITARKRTEGQIMMLRQTIDVHPDGAYWMDTESRFVYVNDAACRAVGYTKEELIGQHVSLLSPGADVERMAEIWRELKTKGSLRSEVLHRRKDGTEFPVEITTTYIQLAEAEYICGFAQNITERLNTERSVKESERKLSTLLSNLPGMAYRCRHDSAWTMEFVNEGARILTGYAPEDIIDNRVISYAEIIHPDDREGVCRQVQEALERKSHFILQYRIRTASGEERWVWSQGRGIFNESDGLIALEGFVIDITKRRRAENEVRTLVQNAPVGIASITDGHFTETNDTLCEILGYSQSELLQRDVRSFFSTEAEAKRLVPNLVARIARGDSVEQEIQARKKDGTVVDLLLRIAPFDPANPAGRSVVIVLDVTAHKQALVLEEAKTKAEAANRAKSGFLANMSHEIRTPLNAILGFCQLLQREPTLTSQQREKLGIIGRNGEHLLNLINDILEMSKIEANRVTLENKPIDLRSMLGDLEASFSTRSREKGLTLSLEFNAPLPPMVLGDSGRLRQILFNLLGNAIKFTAQGSVILRVQGTEQAQNLWQLSFEVEDTGPGISTDEQARLFQPFEQTNTGRLAGTGTGLGLAISRNLARLMGGDLTLKSEPGKGSTFCFKIVMQRHEAAVSAPFDPSLYPELELPLAFKSCRVLIVDDVDDNRRLLVDLLNQSCFELREASNGMEAVATFKSWAPDLILMDLRMPVMDGAEAIRQIRSQQNGKAVKILALTASAFDENRQAILTIGADDFLGKPFLTAKLFEIIRRLLSLKENRKKNGVKEIDRTVTTAEVVRPILPPDTLSAFRDAANAADLSRLREMIAQQERDHPGFARELRNLADSFQYDRLLSLIEPKSKTK